MVEIIPVSTTLNRERQMKVMFGAAPTGTKNKRGWLTVARLAAICHVAGGNA